MNYKEKITWLQRYLKAREQARFLGDCAQEMEAEAEGMRTRLDGMPGAGRDTARLARSVEKVEETRKMADAALDRCAELRIELVAELAKVQHYGKAAKHPAWKAGPRKHRHIPVPFPFRCSR